MTLTIAFGEMEGLLNLEGMILEMVDRNPKVSISAMSEELGVDRNVASRAIRRMKADGLIERIGGTRGYWSIASRETRCRIRRTIRSTEGYQNGIPTTI